MNRKRISNPNFKNSLKEVTGKRKPLKGIAGKSKPAKKPMSYEDALKKYNNDVTKIPGNSRGKRVQ